MKEFFKSLADYVFSFGMFMFLVVTGFVYVLITVSNAESHRREATRVATEICYSQGLVLVDTDAGQRCVAPQSLVKVK
jgi:hypothetical protein